MARKVYSEDKMKELISREGDGEEVPERSKIFFYPDFISIFSLKNAKNQRAKHTF